jgi:hypothetical protein
VKVLPCVGPFFRFVAAAALLWTAQSFGKTLPEAHLPVPFPFLRSPVANESLPENWNDADVFGLRALAEPLVAEPVAASAEENAAFFAAINAFLLSGQAESLEAFWASGRATAGRRPLAITWAS